MQGAPRPRRDYAEEYDNYYTRKIAEEDRAFTQRFENVQLWRLKQYNKMDEWKHLSELEQLDEQERATKLRIALLTGTFKGSLVTMGTAVQRAACDSRGPFELPKKPSGGTGHGSSLDSVSSSRPLLPAPRQATGVAMAGQRVMTDWGRLSESLAKRKADLAEERAAADKEAAAQMAARKVRRDKMEASHALRTAGAQRQRQAARRELEEAQARRDEEAQAALTARSRAHRLLLLHHQQQQQLAGGGGAGKRGSVDARAGAASAAASGSAPATGIVLAARPSPPGGAPKVAAAAAAPNSLSLGRRLGKEGGGVLTEEWLRPEYDADDLDVDGAVAEAPS